MKKLTMRLMSISILFYIVLINSGCSSSFKNVKLNKSYNLSGNQTITTYVIPSGSKELDETYGHVLIMDLTARGYDVIDGNKLLKEHFDKIKGKNHRQIADSLIVKKYFPPSEIYVVAKPSWDSVYVLTYYSEKSYRDYIKYAYNGLFVPSLTSQVALYHKSLDLPIMSFTATDTTYIYSEEEKSKLFYKEFPWMVIAKQISREFADIPICSVENRMPVKFQFNINLWVDNSYREAFSTTWKDRLKLRILYANDILRQQFDIELVISKFIEWNSKFEKTLDESLKKLFAEQSPDPNTIQIGITLDKKLKRNWNNRTNIGLAFLLGEDAIITAQPSYQSVAQDWNAIEESITLAHEVGHLLGAFHVDDRMSIMYPSSGFLSFEFDDMNRKIIQVTKLNLDEQDISRRVQNYFYVLNDIRKSEVTESIEILEPAGSAFSSLIRIDKEIVNDQDSLNSLIINLSPDSAFAFATAGYIDFKMERFKQSKENFKKALELDPNFGEVKKYLLLIADKNEAEQSKDSRSIPKEKIKSGDKKPNAAKQKN